MNIGDIYAGLQIVTPPSIEPLQVQDVCSYLRLVPDGGENDALVSLLTTTVRKQVETILNRALLTQTWKFSLRNWPGRDYINWPRAFTSEIDQYYKYNYIKVPFPPLQSVTSVTYMRSDGTVGTMVPANFTVVNGFSYNVFNTFEPGRIVLPFAGIWPTDVLMPGAPITVTFVAGYTPQTLKNWEGYEATLQAMKLLVSDCWENRIPPSDIESSEQMGVVKKWLAPFRIYD